MPVSSRNGAELGPDGRDDLELAAQPRRGQSVGDRQARGVVGERGVLVAELGRGPGHLLDRRATVRPVRVQVQVAAQSGAQPGRGLVELGQRPGGGRLQGRQVLRLLAGDGLLDHRRRPLADALDPAQAAGLGEQPDVVRGQGGERGGRGPERLDPIARLQRPLEQEGDAAQVGDRVPGVAHPAKLVSSGRGRRPAGRRRGRRHRRRRAAAADRRARRRRAGGSGVGAHRPASSA